MYESRYKAPMTEAVFSLKNRANFMRQITDVYTVYQIRRLGAEAQGLDHQVLSAPDVDLQLWQSKEAQHGHEIVGFIDAYLDRLPSDTHRYVHLLLTSSDLVEYANHRIYNDHRNLVFNLVYRLIKSIQALEMREETQIATRVGRTHGQVAEATNLGHQLQVIRNNIHHVVTSSPYSFADRVLIKTPGPTGFSAANGISLNEVLAVHLEVTGLKGVMVPATQILPRDFLVQWASEYMRLAISIDQLATFIRFGSRSEIGELQEGDADHRQGSSAMANKKNPIDSERITGLSRIAKANFMAIADAAVTWEDRDLSNSSTERLATWSLASTVEYMLTTAIQVVHNLQVNYKTINKNFLNNLDRVHLNREQGGLQLAENIGPIKAQQRMNNG